MPRLLRFLLLCLIPILLLAACGKSAKNEVVLPTVYVPPTLSVFLPTLPPTATVTASPTITPFPSRTPFPPTWTPVSTRTQPPPLPTLARTIVPTNTPFEIPTFDPSLQHPPAPIDPYVPAPVDTGGTSWPVAVTDATFSSEVLNSSTPVLVEYWATWCGPCQEMAPIIEQVASEYSGRMKVAKLDVDANPSTTSLYGIDSIPTFHIFQNGVIISSRVGSMSGTRLHTWIDQSLG